MLINKLEIYINGDLLHTVGGYIKNIKLIADGKVIYDVE